MYTSRMADSERSPCSCDLLMEDVLERLENFRDAYLGPEDQMGHGPPTLDTDQHLVGGTHFERLGQKGVKDSARCFSMTQTHQHARNLVGPTAGGKVYNHVLTENEKLRQQCVQVCRFPNLLMEWWWRTHCIAYRGDRNGGRQAFCPYRVPRGVGGECRSQQHPEHWHTWELCIPWNAAQYRIRCLLGRE